MNVENCIVNYSISSVCYENPSFQEALIRERARCASPTPRTMPGRHGQLRPSCSAFTETSASLAWEDRQKSACVFKNIYGEKP